MVIGREGAKAKGVRSGLSIGRGAVALLVGLAVVGIGFLWFSGRGDPGRGSPALDAGTGQPTDSQGPALERPGALERVPGEEAPTRASQRPADLDLSGGGLEPALVDPRFDGRGRLRGHVEVSGDHPFPESWRLVLAPSTTLMGRELAEERVVELSGTQDFVVEDLPLAGYDLRAEADGWNGLTAPILLDTRNPELFVNLRMVKAGAVDGRIVDHEGAPAGGVVVTLTPVGTSETREVRTDVLGGYRFDSVLDGPYQLGVGPLLSPLLPRATTLRVQAPGMTVPDLELPPLAALTVVMADAEEILLPGVHVTGSCVNGGSLDALTDSYGEVTIRHLRPGRWRLRFDLEGYQTRRDQLDLIAGETRETVFVLSR